MLCCLFLLIVPDTPPEWVAAWCSTASGHQLARPGYSRAKDSDYLSSHGGGGARESFTIVDEGDEDADEGKCVEDGGISTPSQQHSVRAGDGAKTCEANDTADLSELGISETARSGSATAASGGIIKWSTVHDMNWDVVFLLGGGFALSKGFQVSMVQHAIAECATCNFWPLFILSGVRAV